MTAKKIVKGHNLSRIIKKEHEGKWVALSSDYRKVVGYSDDIVKLERKVGKEGVVFMRPGHSDVQYCF